MARSLREIARQIEEIPSRKAKKAAVRNKNLPPLTRWLFKLWPRRSWRRWVVIIVSIVVLVLLIALVVLFTLGPLLLKTYVESESGRQAASRGLGNAVKVDGQFSALHYNKWTIQSDSFQSVGWPGEALGGLNCDKIRIELDPTAIFHHAWRINSVHIDHAHIELRAPDDALKRPPIPKKARAWYLFFLPDHFESGPMVADHTDLNYTFRDKQATIQDAHVQADLIGKDFKYTATSGVLNSPYLPPLHVNRLELLVTHRFIKIYSADLVGLNGDPAHIFLSGTIGMRENKAIDATVHLENVPIEQVLPESLRPLLQGRASGDLTWKSDSNGKMIESEGELTFTGLRVTNLSLFKPLSALGGNSDLENLPFEHANCHFHLQNGVIKMDISAAVINSVALNGTVGFDTETRIADLNLKISQLVLRTWVPTEMKDNTSGEAQAVLQWHGKMDNVKDSTGNLSLNMDGTQIGVPPILKILLRKKQINKAPTVIVLKTGRFDFVYSNDKFQLNRCDLDIPNVLSLKMNGQVSTDNTLTADLVWRGLTVEDWLPASLENQLTGKLEGEAHIVMHDWHLDSGTYNGKLRLINCAVSYTSVQAFLGRFLSDRTLLELPLNRAQFSWAWDNKSIHISDIDFRAGDRLGVQGEIEVASDKALSGRLLMGLQPVYLHAFYGLGDRIFFKNQEGLRWSVLHISGTLDNPQEDFRAQLQREMLKNPISALQLGGKMTSWLIGNWLGANDEWKRPVAK